MNVRTVDETEAGVVKSMITTEDDTVAELTTVPFDVVAVTETVARGTLNWAWREFDPVYR